MKKNNEIMLVVYLGFGVVLTLFLVGLLIAKHLVVGLFDTIGTAVTNNLPTIGIIGLIGLSLIVLWWLISIPLGLLLILRDNKWLWSRALAIAVLLYAMQPLPYDQYVLLKFIVCVISVHTAIKAKAQQEIGWAWVMAILALLFNPVFPIHLAADTWKKVDLVCAIIMGISLKCHVGKDNFPLYTAKADTVHQILPMEQDIESSNIPHVYSHHSE